MRFVSLLILLILVSACGNRNVKPIFEADTLGIRTQRLENSLNSKYDVIINMLPTQNSRLSFASEHTSWLKQRDESCNRLFSAANQYACVYELTLFRTSYYTDFINKLSRNRFADIYFNPYFKEQQNSNVKQDASATQTYTPTSMGSKTDTPEDEPPAKLENITPIAETSVDAKNAEKALQEKETTAETQVPAKEQASPTDSATATDNKNVSPAISEDAPKISPAPSASVEKTVSDKTPSNLIGEPLKNDIPNVPAPAKEAEKI